MQPTALLPRRRLKSKERGIHIQTTCTVPVLQYGFIVIYYTVQFIIEGTTACVHTLYRYTAFFNLSVDCECINEWTGGRQGTSF